jgi:hypothetical protein
MKNITVFQDGRWMVTLRVISELSAAGIITDTDVKATNGVYGVRVSASDAEESRRHIRQLEISGYREYHEPPVCERCQIPRTYIGER